MKNGWVIAAAVLATGCLGIDFDAPSRIRGPRILTITAEPPEVAFGEDVVFETLVVDESGADLSLDPSVELRFMVCISVAEIVRASGLGAGQDLEDNCEEGGDDLIHLVTGEGDLPPNAARLPGAAVLALVLELMEGGPMPEPGDGTIDPRVLETLTLVIAEVGVPLRVRLEVWRDGEQILTGFKRFAITQRASPTTNPPPPRFAVNGAWLSARGGGDPHACVPEDGVQPMVEIGSEVMITPDPDEEAWIEEYPVVSLDGTLQINEESAYYSWFSTVGRFGEDITDRPERDVTWDPGTGRGVVPIWLVVRDGHLGTSYCRAEVRVIAAPE